MKLLSVTLIDPSQPITIHVPPKAAARVIRAWFCTKGVPASTLSIMRNESLNSRYRHDTEITISYRSVPRINPGESIECYARRITRFVRDRTGRNSVTDLLGIHAHNNYDYRNTK